MKLWPFIDLSKRKVWEYQIPLEESARKLLLIRPFIQQGTK